MAPPATAAVPRASPPAASPCVTPHCPDCAAADTAVLSTACSYTVSGAHSGVPVTQGQGGCAEGVSQVAACSCRSAHLRRAPHGERALAHPHAIEAGAGDIRDARVQVHHEAIAANKFSSYNKIEERLWLCLGVPKPCCNEQHLKAAVCRHMKADMRVHQVARIQICRPLSAGLLTLLALSDLMYSCKSGPVRRTPALDVQSRSRSHVIGFKSKSFTPWTGRSRDP